MFGGVQNKEGEYSCVERVGVHGMICHLFVLYAQSLLRCTGLEETQSTEVFALLSEKTVRPTRRAYMGTFASPLQKSASLFVHGIIHTCKNTPTHSGVWH